MQPTPLHHGSLGELVHMKIIGIIPALFWRSKSARGGGTLFGGVLFGVVLILWEIPMGGIGALL